jgi:hypothetical protein
MKPTPDGRKERHADLMGDEAQGLRDGRLRDSEDPARFRDGAGFHDGAKYHQIADIDHLAAAPRPSWRR